MLIGSLGIRLIMWLGAAVPLPPPPGLLQALTDVTVTNDADGDDGFQLTPHDRKERAARLRPARRRGARPDEPGDHRRPDGRGPGGAGRRRDHAPPAPAEQRAGPLDADRDWQGIDAGARPRGAQREVREPARLAHLRPGDLEVRALRPRAAADADHGRPDHGPAHPAAARDRPRIRTAARAAQRLRLLRRARDVRSQSRPTSGRRSGRRRPSRH